MSLPLARMKNFVQGQQVLHTDMLGIQSSVNSLRGALAFSVAGTSAFLPNASALLVTASGPPDMNVTLGGASGETKLVFLPETAITQDYRDAGSGSAKIAYMGIVTQPTVFAVPAAHMTYDRIDIIAVAYQVNQTANPHTASVQTSPTTYVNQTVYDLDDSVLTAYVQGTASASPVAPSPPTNYTVLAQIRVPAGATSITSSDITTMLPTIDQVFQKRNMFVTDLKNGSTKIGSEVTVESSDGSVAITPSGDLTGGTLDYAVSPTAGKSVGLCKGAVRVFSAPAEPAAYATLPIPTTASFVIPSLGGTVTVSVGIGNISELTNGDWIRLFDTIDAPTKSLIGSVSGINLGAGTFTFTLDHIQCGAVGQTMPSSAGIMHTNDSGTTNWWPGDVIPAARQSVLPYGTVLGSMGLTHIVVTASAVAQSEWTIRVPVAHGSPVTFTVNALRDLHGDTSGLGGYRNFIFVDTVLIDSQPAQTNMSFTILNDGNPRNVVIQFAGYPPGGGGSFSGFIGSWLITASTNGTGIDPTIVDYVAPGRPDYATTPLEPE